MLVRLAKLSDSQAITDIYNQGIEDRKLHVRDPAAHRRGHAAQGGRYVALPSSGG